MSPKKPIRDSASSLIEKVPKGPLGFLGGGNAIGSIGFFTVSAVNGVIPIEGVEVGFEVESHDVDRSGNTEKHTFLVHSTSRAMARFVGKYKSTPTNINFLSDEVEVVDVEEVKRRRGFSLWEVTTEVESKGEILGKDVNL